MCLHHDKNKQVQEIKKESLIKALELSSKQACSMSSPAGYQKCEDPEAEPNHNKQKTFLENISNAYFFGLPRTKHIIHGRDRAIGTTRQIAFTTRYQSLQPTRLSLLCVCHNLFFLSLWFLSAIRVPVDQSDSQNIPHSCNKGHNHSFAFLPPFGSLLLHIENQTHQLNNLYRKDCCWNSCY